jgi:hypothetical protein
MKRFLAIALLVAFLTPAAAQTEAAPPPVTRDEAMTLPPDELAQIALRQLGARVTNVTRPNFGASSDARIVSALSHLMFATAPHATDVVGICTANLIEVSFERPPTRPGVDNNRAETPVQAREALAMQVYKAVGEIEPFAEVSEMRQAEEERRCAEAGPVIGADLDDRARADFFHFEGSVAPVTALLALQRAIGEARAGRYRDIRCTANATECRNPAALLGSLDLANLGYVQVAPTGVGADRDRYRIEASFLIRADAHDEQYWVFAMEAQIDELDRRSDPIRRLGPSRFTRSRTIRD